MENGNVSAERKAWSGNVLCMCLGTGEKTENAASSILEDYKFASVVLHTLGVLVKWNAY